MLRVAQYYVPACIAVATGRAASSEVALHLVTRQCARYNPCKMAALPQPFQSFA